MKVQSFAFVTGALMAVAAGSTVLRAQPIQLLTEFRTADGRSNNVVNPDWGRAGIMLMRRTAVDYGDGTNSPAGAGRASPRRISNGCVTQTEFQQNSRHASDFIWQWGQFIDHDLDLTPSATPDEPFNIPVPIGDAFFDPFSTGTQVIGLSRSDYVMDEAGVRQQRNVLTAFNDASMVYGSDDARAQALRALDGTGRLKISPGNLLPFNVGGIPNGPSGTDPTHFLAGDVRANEQVGLTTIQTLFVREHNYWADHFHGQFAEATDEQLYQWARAMVTAEIEVITYRDWLPLLLGPGVPAPYTGYKTNVNPGIENVFSTAAFRVGHTMLSPTLLRLNEHGQPIAAGNLPLQNSFFNPPEVTLHGLDPVLRGLASQVAQEVDMFLVDDVRNFLFGPPGAGGFDLASLNIQRGRDHGLCGYNAVRSAYGLATKPTFADMSSDPHVQTLLADSYTTPDEVDVWVGGLCESHMPGAMVGETFFAIIKDQFERVRDGDRFWYQNYLPEAVRTVVEEQTLSVIIRRNTSIGTELQDNAFLAPGPKLNIQRISNQLVISWPNNSSNFVLQSSTSVNGGTWTDVPSQNNTATVDANTPAQFLRLVLR